MKSRTFYIYKGQIREDNDCILRAIEYVLNLPYPQIERVCRHYGFDGQGMTLKQTMLASWELTNKKPRFKNIIEDDIKLSDAKFSDSIIFVKPCEKTFHAIGCKDNLDLSMAKKYLDFKVNHIIYP